MIAVYHKLPRLTSLDKLKSVLLLTLVHMLKTWIKVNTEKKYWKLSTHIFLDIFGLYSFVGIISRIQHSKDQPMRKEKYFNWTKAHSNQGSEEYTLHKEKRKRSSYSDNYNFKPCILITAIEHCIVSHVLMHQNLPFKKY